MLWSTHVTEYVDFQWIGSAFKIILSARLKRFPNLFEERVHYVLLSLKLPEGVVCLHTNSMTTECVNDKVKQKERTKTFLLNTVAPLRQHFHF